MSEKSVIEALQKRFQVEMEKMNVAKREYQECVSKLQNLTGQMAENDNVREELALLDEDKGNIVFKLIGPMLVKQDLQESKLNVDKRIVYIKEEIQRLEKVIKDDQKKMETLSDSITKTQQELQTVQGKIAAK